MNHLTLASNSAHTPWWIGLPVLVLALIFRVGFWRARGRRGNGPWGNGSDKDDERD
jgi:hypothetical protein